MEPVVSVQVIPPRNHTSCSRKRSYRVMDEHARFGTLRLPKKLMEAECTEYSDLSHDMRCSCLPTLTVRKKLLVRYAP